MRSLVITTIIMATIATQSLAETTVLDQEAIERCSAVSQSAREAMTIRQQGVAQDVSIKKMASSSAEVMSIVMHSFDLPVFDDAAESAKLIDGFASYWNDRCIEKMKLEQQSKAVGASSD